jgi:predicted Zn finger-like uncharacterized protein
MIITCPNCRTRYQIKPLTLGSRGRTVRCSSCGHRWFVRPEGEPEAAPPPIPPAPSPVRVAAPAPELAPEGPSPLAKAPPPSAVGEVPARSGGGLAGWLVLALIVLLLAAAVLGRDQVVAALPPALPVYQHLGLPVTLHLGLEFADLGSSRRDAGGTPGVTISGQVRNTTDREAPVPELRVALLDDRHRELRSQLFDPPQPTLPPGGSMRFELELPDPPTDARDFTISFADQP